MNHFKPAVSFEPTNDYDKAKQDVVKAMVSIRKLPQQQQQALAEELFGATNVATVINLFNTLVSVEHTRRQKP